MMCRACLQDKPGPAFSRGGRLCKPCRATWERGRYRYKHGPRLPKLQKVAGRCVVDGLPILSLTAGRPGDHTRCSNRDCAILIGPGHLEERVYRGGLCGDCAKTPLERARR